MRNVLISILLLSFVCCNNKTVKEKSFDLIDLSIDDGWMNYYCLKVYNDGQTFIFNSYHGRGEVYYKINLVESEIDSVNKMTNSILSQQFDSLYQRRCADCGSYNLIIKSKNKNFQSHVEGIVERENELKTMNNLVIYLNKIAETAKDKLDSSFHFESRTKEFYPVPPPPFVEKE